MVAYSSDDDGSMYSRTKSGENAQYDKVSEINYKLYNNELKVDNMTG